MSEDFVDGTCGKVCPENRTVACVLAPGHERTDPWCTGISYVTETMHAWRTVPDDDGPADWQQEGWFETRPHPMPPPPLGWTGDPEPLPKERLSTPMAVWVIFFLGVILIVGVVVATILILVGVL